MGISMGKWPNFEYHVGKWLKYDRFGSNSSQPTLGSPLNLVSSWRPLATIADMLENGHFGGNWPFWVFILVSYIPAAAAAPSFQFFRFRAILPINKYYFHFSLWFSLHNTEQNQVMLLHDLHWPQMEAPISSKFCKVLQISVRPNMCEIF